MMDELDFSFAHVGINNENEAEALKAAELLKAMFGFDMKIGNSSVFTANKHIELNKKTGYGRFGHIGIATADVDAAVSYLEALGYGFIESSRKVKDGVTTAIYLENELTGFAIHLVKK